MTPAFDWPALLRAGLQVLRMNPQEFWSLTPAELGMLLGLDPRPAPMGRARFLDLLAAHPDREATP